MKMNLVFKFYYINCGTEEKNNNFPHFHVNLCKITQLGFFCASLGSIGNFGHKITFEFSTFHVPTGSNSQHSNTVTTTVPQNGNKQSN